MTERLREYAGAGAETVVFAPACGPADLPRVLATFAAEVLPELRQVPAGGVAGG